MRIRLRFAASIALRIACWNLLCLARPEADDAVLITNDDQGREGQVLSALDHFGNAVDRNHLILEIKSVSR